MWLYREILTLRPLGHSVRPSALGNLADVLLIRFKKSGRSEDLNEVINLQREAVSLYHLGSLNRPSAIANLGNAILLRSKLNEKSEDPRESMKH